MRHLVALLAALSLVLSACGGDSVEDKISEQIAEEILEDSGIEDVEIDEDEGTIELTVEGDDGDETLTIGGSDLPDDFPFPTPDEFNVGSTYSVDQAGETMFNAVLEIPADDFDDVLAMYEDFLDDEGFEVEKSEISAEGSTVIFLSGTSGDADALVTLTKDESETFVTLTWAPSG